jgi:hypothetical protein
MDHGNVDKLLYLSLSLSSSCHFLWTILHWELCPWLTLSIIKLQQACSGTIYQVLCSQKELEGLPPDFKKICFVKVSSHSCNLILYMPKKVKQSRYTPWWRLGERKYSSNSFLTSALDSGEWSASRPGRDFPRGNDLRYPLYRRLDGPQSRSGHRG